MGADKSEVLQGTLDLMILKTLQALGPQHGFGIARRIEQISEQALKLNEGTVYTSPSGFSSKAGSVPNGACRKTIAGRGFIRSPKEVGSSWRSKRRIGKRSRGSSGECCSWRNRNHVRDGFFAFFREFAGSQVRPKQNASSTTRLRRTLHCLPTGLLAAAWLGRKR